MKKATDLSMLLGVLGLIITISILAIFFLRKTGMI